MITKEQVIWASLASSAKYLLKQVPGTKIKGTKKAMVRKIADLQLSLTYEQADEATRIAMLKELIYR